MTGPEPLIKVTEPAIDDLHLAVEQIELGTNARGLARPTT
jgi:hypothetical protein